MLSSNVEYTLELHWDDCTNKTVLSEWDTKIYSVWIVSSQLYAQVHEAKENSVLYDDNHVNQISVEKKNSPEWTEIF